MNRAKAQHILSDINHDMRVANCEKCGSVRISKPNKYGFSVCMVALAERSRVSKYRVKYGIDIRNNPPPASCELCEGSQRIAYDHSHQNGKFRGWLCMKCNTALGLVNDNPEILRKLAEYLEK